MAKLHMNFNVNELPVSENNFEPLPAGWYTASISQADVTTPQKYRMGKDENDIYVQNLPYKMLNIRWDILGPTHQGRVIFDSFFIQHADETPQKIGMQKLQQLLTAAGIIDLNDTDQLISVTVQIKLSVKESEYQGEKQVRNEIKGYKALESGGAPMPVAKAKAPAVASAGSTPPWVKK